MAARLEVATAVLYSKTAKTHRSPGAEAVEPEMTESAEALYSAAEAGATRKAAEATRSTEAPGLDR